MDITCRNVDLADNCMVLMGYDMNDNRLGSEGYNSVMEKDLHELGVVNSIIVDSAPQGKSPKK